MGYAVADAEERYRVASTARTKLNVVKAVLDRHPGEPALVIGAYLEQLDELGEALGCPVVQGSTRNREREALFDAFRRGEVPRLTERASSVYKQAGMPCPVCGSKVRTQVVAGRNLFWCGRCQRRR